jgi:hypothetical protein
MSDGEEEEEDVVQGLQRLAFCEDGGSPLFGKDRGLAHLVARMHVDADTRARVLRCEPRRAADSPEDAAALALIHCLGWPDARDPARPRCLLYRSLLLCFEVRTRDGTEKKRESEELESDRELVRRGFYVVYVVRDRGCDSDKMRLRTLAAVRLVARLREQAQFEDRDFAGRVIVVPDDREGGAARREFRADELRASAGPALLEEPVAGAARRTREALSQGFRPATTTEDPPEGEMVVHLERDAEEEAAPVIPTAEDGDDEEEVDIATIASIRSSVGREPAAAPEAKRGLVRIGFPAPSLRAPGAGHPAPSTAYESCWIERMQSFSPDQVYRDRTARIAAELAGISQRLLSAEMVASPSVGQQQQSAPPPHWHGAELLV